ncbi:Predicted acetyltransferase [Streptomyces zhaozhouensis]|uniref:Predicted acetyltransferase n=1 Tax=Streptomyces zhaozhouensis TaxID=1300267 RepID=A0A286E0W5_9ACTN|nr:GNAT family N-acetyltransferase [Streptomyces zhaozhouensis]SOD64549.1 Predicted acetyltransferase [Streptomyces zhaozhouensis]
MSILITPRNALRSTFLEAVREFRGEGRGGASDDTMLGHQISVWRDRWADEAGFDEYVRSLIADARPETPRPQGMVPSTTLWFVDGETWLGRLSIRHRLTPRLMEWGGTIGYDIRPSARNRGHGRAMLRAALPHAWGLGFDPVLVTCDAENIASRKVIEASGGVFEDKRGEKLRYWIPTSPS